MKYRKEVQQHATFLLHHPYHVAHLILVSLTRRADFFGSIAIILSVASYQLTLGEVGEVRGIFKCNYSKQFGKLLSNDRHRFRLLQLLESQRRHDEANPYDFEVDKSVRGMTSHDESTWKQSVRRCAENTREGGRARATAKCMKAFTTSLREEFRRC